MNCDDEIESLFTENFCGKAFYIVQKRESEIHPFGYKNSLSRIGRIVVKYIRFIRAEMRPSGFHMTLFSIAWAEWCYHVEADESFYYREMIEVM